MLFNTSHTGMRIEIKEDSLEKLRETSPTGMCIEILNKEQREKNMQETSPAGMCIEIRYVLLSIPERVLKHPLRGCVLKCEI